MNPSGVGSAPRATTGIQACAPWPTRLHTRAFQHPATPRGPGGARVAAPVGFRWSDGAFEVVIAEDDLKEHRLEHDPRCSLLVFEMAYPFRGIEARGEAELTR